MTRRVLICTIGQTPQVVTETVWALKNPEKPAVGEESRASWLPDEIHVVTTAVGFWRVRDGMQARASHLSHFFPKGSPPVTIHVPRASGKADIFRPLRPQDEPSEPAPDKPRPYPASADALRDVNSQGEAAIMGDVILQLIARFAKKNDTEIHISLAGGRKTMSAHALLALTVVGRPQDGASHVLISPQDFEDNFEFWHPDQAGGLIRRKLRPGEDRATVEPSLDPKKAHVTLVPTPTPLIRHQVKHVERLDKLRLVDVVRELNLAAELARRPHLTLYTARNTIAVGNTERRLNVKAFAVYRLIATAWKEQWPGTGPVGDGEQGWLSVPLICVGRTPANHAIANVLLEFLRQAVDVARGDRDDQRTINSLVDALDVANPIDKLKAVSAFIGGKTRLIKEIEEEFGPSIAAIIAPEWIDKRQQKPLQNGQINRVGASRFGLHKGFDPAAIAISPAPAALPASKVKSQKRKPAGAKASLSGAPERRGT